MSSTQPSRVGDGLGRRMSKTKPLPPQMPHTSSSEKPSTNKSVCAPESTPHLLPTCYVQATEQVASIHINLSHSKSCYDQNKKSLRDRPGNNISLFKNSLIKELSLAEIIRMELYSSIFITMIVTLIVQIISGKTDTHKLSSILPFLCCCMHHCTAPLMSSVSGGACVTARHQCPRSSTK